MKHESYALQVSIDNVNNTLFYLSIAHGHRPILPRVGWQRSDGGTARCLQAGPAQPQGDLRQVQAQQGPGRRAEAHPAQVRRGGLWGAHRKNLCHPGEHYAGADAASSGMFQTSFKDVSLNIFSILASDSFIFLFIKK